MLIALQGMVVEVATELHCNIAHRSLKSHIVTESILLFPRQSYPVCCTFTIGVKKAED